MDTPSDTGGDTMTSSGLKPDLSAFSNPSWSPLAAKSCGTDSYMYNHEAIGGPRSLACCPCSMVTAVPLSLPSQLSVALNPKTRGAMKLDSALWREAPTFSKPKRQKPTGGARPRRRPEGQPDWASPAQEPPTRRRCDHSNWHRETSDVGPQ